MAESIAARDRPLNILHVLRAPVGGLFRHVLDLSRGQIEQGHRVGLVTDTLTGGETAARILAELEPRLRLGLRRLPMRRNPHATDIPAVARIARWSRETGADVVHGHGSKGGFYARVPAMWSGPSGPARVYTPHGGSLNHRPGGQASRFYMRVERALAARTDLLLFESHYIAGRFDVMVGPPKRLHRVIHNGIAASEFSQVDAAPDAVEFLYVGELRAAKGIDTLIEALALVSRRLGRAPRACLVGSGPEKGVLQQQADRLGIGQAITFAGALPARQAFTRGRILVLPSRAESLPYIVLEAVGAGIPLITTRVGGIVEIFGPHEAALLPPDDVPRLADRMIESLSTPPAELAKASDDLRDFVRRRFSIEAMVEGIVGAYRDALALRKAESAPVAGPLMMSPADQGTQT